MAAVQLDQEIRECEVDNCEGGKCVHVEVKGEVSTYDEASFAVLLAMVPLLVFTLFGQVGLL